jgi:hypothetical protein
MLLFVLPGLISLLCLLSIVVINNFISDQNIKLNLFSSTFIAWSLAVFLTSYFILLPKSGHQITLVLNSNIFLFLIIFILSFCSILIKSQAFRFLTLSSFLLILTLIPYLLNLFQSSGIYDDNFYYAKIFMFFIFGPIALTSFCIGLIVFFYARKILSKR